MTGATGCIGGSVLEGVVKKFPDLQIAALLRSPSASADRREAAARSIISKASKSPCTISTFGYLLLNSAGDHNHAACAAAILSGLDTKTTPTFLIHLTGTGCISDEREQNWEGNYNPRVWDDIKDIQEIYDLPDSVKHHIMDKRILDASNELLKTACVCPPDICGQSTGTGNRATFLVPEYVKYEMEREAAFYLGKGENVRAVTHINDVVDLFVILVDQAIQGGGSAQWGKEGFYFAVSSEVKWIEVAQAVNKISIQQRWLPADSKPVSWTETQLAGLMKHIPIPGLALYLWGSNSRANSARAAKLGWKPHGPSFWEALEEDVSVAVAKLNA